MATRIRGIELKIHPSLLILLVYLMFITTVRFRSVAVEAGVNPDMLSGTPLAWSLFFALCLFASVILHELGHAFTAQTQGLKVKSITLMMLGGVSQIERMPERPGMEFKLAVMGPVVSFVLAGILLFAHTQAQSPNLMLATYWLGTANMALGIFNMLPAFPLDGGRALRSALSIRRGPLQATQIAVRISKVLAWTLGILGLLTFNILLTLIAFFIYTAAEQELFFQVTKRALKGMSVGEVTTRVDPVLPGATLESCVDQMVNARVSALPVQSPKPGTLRIDQIRRIRQASWHVTRVQDVYLPARRVLSASEPVGDALHDLAGAVGGCLPVEDNGVLVGIAKFSDVSEILQLRSLQRAVDEDQETGLDRAA